MLYGIFGNCYNGGKESVNIKSFGIRVLVALLDYIIVGLSFNLIITYTLQKKSHYGFFMIYSSLNHSK